MVIIAILLSLVNLSIGDGNLSRKMEQETQRLASLLDLASQEAIFQSKQMGIFFEEKGYHFYRLQDQQWQIITESDSIFRQRRLPDGIQIHFQLEGQAVSLYDNTEKLLPHLFIFSSGEFIPFKIVFNSEANDNFYYQLTGNMMGKMVIKQIEDEFETF
ncbi:MAG: GspH/FimT family protein [Thiomargarita sp.]|nr:GspH/FimT family protein [Bacteroidales bacterium]MCK5719394.1 GspH/FimT family protein [Thiomargarita sp.]